MIQPRDMSCIERLAPVAQLLELLGQKEGVTVHSQDVFASMARDVWRVYWYLNARFGDEFLGEAYAPCDERYFKDLESRVNRFLDKQEA